MAVVTGNTLKSCYRNAIFLLYIYFWSISSPAENSVSEPHAKKSCFEIFDYVETFLFPPFYSSGELAAPSLTKRKAPAPENLQLQNRFSVHIAATALGGLSSKSSVQLTWATQQLKREVQSTSTGWRTLIFRLTSSTKGCGLLGDWTPGTAEACPAFTP